MEESTGLTRRQALLATVGAASAGALTAFATTNVGQLVGTTTANAGPLTRKLGYTDPWHAKVRSAGYRLKTADVNGVTFSYAEGPNNGPALVLLHAQQMDWFSYSRVLPGLSKTFHVFDVDYQGHGQTTTPADYPMHAGRIGSDLAAFLERVVQGPAYVTGNSSGGLLTAWLAANRPDLVRAAILEDPPLFASEYPRIKKTIAYRGFKTSALAVEQRADDFLLFWIRGSKPFFTKHVGPGSAFLLTQAVKARRRVRPGEPVEIGLIPDDTVRLFLRGMDHQFDPRFGAAFYHGTWNEGFSHAEALSRITRPTLLLHADTSWTDGDILDGAMSQQDADRAMSLLQGGEYQRIDASHVVHLDKPAAFTSIVEAFFLVKHRGA